MDQAEIEKLIGELEIAVDRLRSLYEQYFMGIEKLEPSVPRKDVDRRIHVLRKVQLRNTALRFRFHMLLQRYNTYQSYWQRICRDIENGTYKRHVIRAQQRFGAKPASVVPPPAHAKVLPASAEAELAELDREFAPAATLDDADVQLDDDESSAIPSVFVPARAAETGDRSRVVRPDGKPSSSLPPRAPPPPRTRPPGVPPSAPASLSGPPSGTARAPLAAASAPLSNRAARAPGAAPATKTPIAAASGAHTVSSDLPDDRVRQLYGQYVDAKRRQNESTAAITYDAVAKSLRESSAKLRGRHGKAVDFEVTIKDGRAIIRPVIK